MCTRVPRFTTDIMQALSTPGVVGLHQLRLVSKDMRSAMTAHVNRCVLPLDGIGSNMVPMMSVLKTAKLQCLDVIVTPGVCLNQHLWGAHKTQMDAFVSCMTAALRGVTDVKIVSDRSTMELDMCQLALACPALRQVWVNGHIGVKVLNSFGAQCAGLNKLKLSQATCFFPIGSCVVLPALEHLEVLGLPDAYIQYGTRRVLKDCLLTTLTAPGMHVRAELWNLLPVGLRDLECTVCKCLPADAKILPCLLTLTAHSLQRRSTVNLRAIASLVERCPALAKLEVLTWPHELPDLPAHTYLATHCGPLCGEALVYMDGRVSAGLDFKLNLMLIAGSVIGTDADADAAMGFLTLSDFISSLSRPLTSITRLMLDSSEKTADHELSADFVRIFPGLRFMCLLANTCFKDIDLQRVSKLPVLECLSMSTHCVHYDNYDISQITLICRNTKALRVIRVHCEQFPDFHDRLQERFRAWEIDVRVERYPNVV